MSHSVLNMIADIRAGIPVGIVKHKPVNPRDFYMYGRADSATIGEHLDEFDTWRDDKGRSFDEAVAAGLPDDDATQMPPPPVPILSKAASPAPKRTLKDVENDMERLDNYHLAVAQKHYVENPEYTKALQKQAMEGVAKKRKAEEEADAADMRARNAKALKGREEGAEPDASESVPAYAAEARKRPFQKTHVNRWD